MQKIVRFGNETLESLSSCPALIIAGGRGKRLRSVYNVGPKCMAPVGGRRFLEYLLLWVRLSGIRDVVMCVGHKKRNIQDWLGDGYRFGINVTYSAEKELLGTAGALKLAECLITSEPFFVLNGDSFLNVDLQHMYRYHVDHKALATIAIVKHVESARYGRVEIERDGRIAAFHEKSSLLQTAKELDNQFINGGVYLLQRNFLNRIPTAKVTSLETEIFPALVGAKLYGFATTGYFIDIGTPADFERAQSELPQRFP